MRRNFAQVLREGKIDINKEYEKLLDMFYNADDYRDSSLEDIIIENFEQVKFRGTCLSLEEFNETYGFNFDSRPSDFDINYFISFCEYFYNFAESISERDYY